MMISNTFNSSVFHHKTVCSIITHISHQASYFCSIIIIGPTSISANISYNHIS